MKVHELIKLLEQADQDALVCVMDNGSCLPTAQAIETQEYNKGNGTNEYFIVTEEYE